MNQKISVIVPVYNVEGYLPECLNSILEQTYKNLEIILIDDGSTDHSGNICDEYASKDKRIKVIHKKNGGAASAKNVGLKIASGEYLAFVDSDDYLEPTAYSYMVEQLKVNHADVVQCSFQNIYVNMQESVVKILENKVFEVEDYLKRFTTDWTCGLLWDKLYYRKLFDGIYFEEGHKIDDEFFTYQGIMNAHRIVHTPQIIYNYRKRKSSVMVSEKSQSKILMDKLDYLEKRRIKVSNKYPNLKQDFDYHFLNMLLILSTDKYATAESILEIKKILKKYFSEKKVCKMEPSLRIRLITLQYSKLQKILSKKRMGDILIDNQYIFFE